MATLVMLCSRLVTVMTTTNVTTALTLCGYAIETPRVVLVPAHSERSCK